VQVEGHGQLHFQILDVAWDKGVEWNRHHLAAVRLEHDGPVGVDAHHVGLDRFSIRTGPGTGLGGSQSRQQAKRKLDTSVHAPKVVGHAQAEKQKMPMMDFPWLENGGHSPNSARMRLTAG
jgi:hypothetical protein